MILDMVRREFPLFYFSEEAYLSKTANLKRVFFNVEFNCFIPFRNFVQKLLTTDRNKRIGKGEVCHFIFSVCSLIAEGKIPFSYEHWAIYSVF